MSVLVTLELFKVVTLCGIPILIENQGLKMVKNSYFLIMLQLKMLNIPILPISSLPCKQKLLAPPMVPIYSICLKSEITWQNTIKTKKALPEGGPSTMTVLPKD